MKKQLKLIIPVFILTFISAFLLLKILNNDSKKNQVKKPEQESEISTNNTSTNQTNSTILSNTTNTTLAFPFEKTLHTSSTGNCTASWGKLSLINPNFTVDEDFIANRRAELINITDFYGIREGNPGNGEPLLDAEAAVYLNEMLKAYTEAYEGHEITTRSCFRSVGTDCGRLCVATGGSDHHSGYTCDLIDDSYTDSLDTELLPEHYEWQWLHENSYKFGFIDRFPEAWAGGSMDEPANINAEGTTGLYETWHYRYVGVDAATEIATGKYNNGEYDSLEHYLLSKGFLLDLLDLRSCAV